MRLNTQFSTASFLCLKYLQKRKDIVVMITLSSKFRSLCRAGMLLCLEKAFDIRRSLEAQCVTDP